MDEESWKRLAERVAEAALEGEAALMRQYAQAEREFKFTGCGLYMTYKGEEIGEAYRMDLLVDKRLVVECKATEANNPVYAAQCLTYLRGAGLSLGLVVNFGCAILRNGIERVANGFKE